MVTSVVGSSNRSVLVKDKVFFALEDLLDRMELDFSQKFVKDFTHGLDKEIEIGRIKISFLDGVRRSLHMAMS